VIWIDWYAYHVARFRGLESAMPDQVMGIELVGGVGVHTGLKFREELPADLPVVTLMPNVSWRDASKLELARMVWNKLSEIDPDVVLVPGYYTVPGIAIALWARVHGAQSVLMTESCSFDHARTGWKERVKSLGMRLLFNWAVAGGRAHVEYLHQLGFPADRIVGFYDVVDNQMFREGTSALRAMDEVSMRTRYGLPESRYFVYVGRLAPEKNVQTLLASWIRYREAGGDWPLVLVGDGPEAASLRAAAAASRFTSDVYFPGLKSSKQLLPFYAFAGCFVLPSSREPWGLVVNEAMASSLPVLVTSRCGCAQDLVAPGRNGFVYEANDEVGLSGLLMTMSSMDAEQHAALCAASAEIISGYSPQKLGQSIASIANSVGRAGQFETVTGDTP
jgi:glycosyltransferase involved in cell wall biosynthesis